MAFSNLQDDSDDDLVRQSVLEFDDRLDEITAEDFESGTVVSFPEGTENDIDAEDDHGTVNITVETHSDYWEVTDPDGELVDDDVPGQTNSTDFDVGTLVHDGEDGKIAYQGGAVFEKQDGHVTVISPPDIFAEDDTLDLSFVDISSIDLVQQGNDLELQSDPQRSAERQESIMRVIEKQMRSEYPDGDFVASANVTLNITSDYAEGWKNYAETNLETSDVTFYEESTIPEDRDKVVIELGTFGEGLENVPEAPNEFNESVLYSGMSEYAEPLHNRSRGNIESNGEDEYEVDNYGDNTTGILYNSETRGSGPEWWAYNGSYWINVEDPTADPLDHDEPDVVDGVSGGEFEIEDDTWSCVVTDTHEDPDEFRNYIPSADEYDDSDHHKEEYGCLTRPVDVDMDDWEDYVGSFEPKVTVTDFTVIIEDDDGDVVHDPAGVYDPNEPELIPGTDELEPDYNVEVIAEMTNVGYREATEDEGVLVAFYEQSNNPNIINDPDFDPGLLDFEKEELAEGDSDTLTNDFDVEPNPNNYWFTVGAGTYWNASDFSGEWEVDVPTDSPFDVDILEVDDDDGDAEEGDEVSVTIEVDNVGDDEDTQEVWLWGEEEGDALLGTEEVTVPGEDKVEVEIEWTTRANRESGWNEVEAVVPTSDNETQADIEVQEADDDPPEFTIEAVEFNDEELSEDELAAEVEEGDEVVVVVDVENEGGQTGVQQVRLHREPVDDDENERTTSETVEIESGETEEGIEVTWQTISGDAQDEPYELTVETDDDEFTFNLDVLPRADGSNFQVDIEEIDDPVLAGDTMWVNGTITNEGEEDTQTVYLQSVGIPDEVEGLQLDNEESEPFNLSWATTSEDVGTHDVSVLTDDDIETVEDVEVDPRESGEAEFEIDIKETDSPVTEGEPLGVSINVTNTGTASGSTVVALQDFEDQYVNVTQDDISLSEGESWEGTLTWFTLAGLVDGDETVTDDITVEAGDAKETETVDIEPRESTRKPVDVTFVLDETGSMGAPFFPENIAFNRDYYDSDTNPPNSPQTVPEGEVWVLNIDCGWGCEEQYYYGGGEEIHPSDYQNPLQSIDKFEAEYDKEDFLVHAQFAPSDEMTVPDGEFWRVIESGWSGTEHWFNPGDTVEFDDFDFDRSNVDDGVFKYESDVREAVANPSGTATVPEGEVWIACWDGDCNEDWRDNFGNLDYSALVYNEWEYFGPGETIDFDSLRNFDDTTDNGVVKYDVSDDGTFRGYDPTADRMTAVRGALGALEEEDRAGLVQFDTGVGWDDGHYYHDNAGTYQDLTSDINQVNESLKIDPGWGTDISAGVREGSDLLDNQQEENHAPVMIVLTDGFHTEGHPYPDSDETLDYVGDEMTVYTVGFGAADDDELTTLAEEAGTGEGEFYPANDSEDLVEIFEELPEEFPDDDEPELDINWANVDETPVAEGEEVTVEAEVENVGEGLGEVPVTLLDWDDNPVDGTLLNLSTDLTGGDTTVELTWDTTGVLDDEDQDGDLTVITSENEEAVPVTVQDRSADFDIQSLSVDDGVKEGETVEFTVDVNNIDDAPDAQRLWVEYEDSSGDLRTVATSDRVQLDPGEDDTVSIDWDTSAGDSSIEEVAVRTEDDEESTPVDIEETESEDAEFEVYDIDAPDSGTVGQEVQVDAGIRNENGSEAEFPAQVQLIVDDGDEEEVVDSTVVSLSEDESAEEAFSWWPADDGEYKVTVEAKTAGDNTTESTEVEVEEIATGDSDYVVNNLDTNSNEGVADPITENEDLLLDFVIENDGDDGEEQTIAIKREDAGATDPVYVGSVETRAIPENEDDSFVDVVVPANKINADTEKIIVETEDGNDAEQAVEIEESSGDADVDVSIDESDIDKGLTRAEAVDAGETITIPVDIENTGSEEIDPDELNVILSEWLPGVTDDFTMTNVTTVGESISPGETDRVEIVWDTVGNGWDDAPWEVKVQAGDDDDIVILYVNEVEGQLPGGPGFDDDGSGIGIDIDDIQVG